MKYGYPADFTAFRGQAMRAVVLLGVIAARKDSC
jgi:hypothetical protein